MSARRASGSASPRAGAAPGRAFDTAAVVTAAESHVGRVRSVNQDSYGAWRDPAHGAQLLFVADGMGGHRGGEVASRLAVEQVGLAFGEARRTSKEWLERAFERANRAIFETARGDAELAGMGTTGVALLLTGEPSAWIAHVGDSRAYRARDGVLALLTADHSVVGELVRRGQLTPEQARVHPQSNEILRALGTQPEVDVELTEVEVHPGDRFLLCSDGLSGMLPDDSIAAALAGATPAAAVARLVELANAAGGTDNITVQIADIAPGGPRTAAGSGAASGGPGERSGGVAAAPAAAGSWLRWAVALALVAALLLLLLGGESSG